MAQQNEDLVVNTLENEVDVESELSKLDGLLEQVTSQTAKQQASVQNQPVPSGTAATASRWNKNRTAGDPGKSCEKHSGGRKMADNITPVVNETKPVSDEVSVITEGTIIKGDIVSNGSLDIRGNVQGDIGCNGKLVVTGTVTGNSNSSEFFADAAKIEGEVVSTGTVKIGLGSVIIGNVTSSSAVIAGAIKGDIDVQGPVVVDTSAVVMGNIKSRSVQINNGAVIEGFCSQCYSDVDVESLFASKNNE